MKFYILIYAFLILGIAKAQDFPVGIDSIDNKLEILKNDTSKINYIIKISRDNAFNYELLPYAFKALQLSEKIKSEEFIAKSHRLLAGIYYTNLDFNKTLLYSKKSEIYYKSSRNYTKLTENYINSSRAYYYLGYYDLAIHERKKAILTAEKITDSLKICRLYRAIGLGYMMLDKKELALQYYQKSLKISLAKKYEQHNAYNYTAIGRYYYMNNNFTEAIEFYYKALNISIKNNLAHPRLLCSIRLSKSYIAVNKLDSALKYCEVVLFTKPSKFKNEAFMLASKIYLEKGEIKKAISYIDSSYNFTLKMKNNSLLNEVYEIYQEIYKKTGNSKNLLIYEEMQIANYDSIISNANKQKVKNIEILTDIDEFERANRLLEEEKEQNNIELRTSRIINIASVILIIVGLIIVVLIYFALRKIKIKNITILEQKNEIQTQNEELLVYKNHLENIVKKRTAAFVKAKEHAEESDRLKTAFLNNVSHEFRTPMNGILGFSNLLINTESTEKQIKYGEIIEKSCQKLLNIVEDTVEISKVQSKQVKIHNSITNISSLVSEAVNEFKNSALLKGINIELELKLRKEQLLIEVDKNKLNRVFWHLIDNAIKFTLDGSVKITGESLKNNQIQFTIADSGIGIPKELQEKIFDPFRQVETSSVRAFGGNGIGLSLVKEYIEMIGGKIWLESEIDKGTTVFFTILLTESIKKEIEKQTVTIGDINNKIILITEDDEMNYILVKEILSNYKVKLLHCWNGKEAVTILNEVKQIDLILMDLKMPVMDGYEALKQIKEMNSNIPVIAQTAYTSDHAKEKMQSAGFDGFITKPINEDKLLQIIKQKISI